MTYGKTHEEVEQRGATTSRRNAEEEETSNRRCSNNKIIETPQMKAVRAKALQRLNIGNESSPLSSEALRTAGNKGKISSKNCSSKPRSDKTSRDNNVNKVTLTPQMRVLYEKIKHRKSNASLSKTTQDSKNEEQGLNVANQKSTRTWKKQEKNIAHRESIARNKHDIEEHKNQNVQELHGPNVSSKCNCIDLYLGIVSLL